jgi:tetratricopeptide (TPR) repeat protein
MPTSNFAEHEDDFLAIAENMIGQNLLSDALALAHEQRRIKPTDVEGYVIAVKVLIRMGEIEQARDILNEIDEKISLFSLAYARIVDIFSEQGLKTDAAICYRKFDNLKPVSQQAQETAEKLSFFEKQESDAADSPGECLVNILQPEFITLTLAELYLKQGHLQMARDVLTEIVKREPSNVNAVARLNSVKAAMSKVKIVNIDYDDPDILVETLSVWLDDIDRLKVHAKGK